MKKPKWIRDAIRIDKARRRYFIRRYGDLERMHKIDAKTQADADAESFEDEMAYMEEKAKQTGNNQINQM